MTNSNFYSYKKILKRRCSEFKTDSEFMHGYTLGLLHGEGHEVLYANHMYVNEGVLREVTAFQTFYEQYLEINKAHCILDLN
jgi:tRNA (guanine-N7-)-methyltransferase